MRELIEPVEQSPPSEITATQEEARESGELLEIADISETKGTSMGLFWDGGAGFMKHG